MQRRLKGFTRWNPPQAVRRSRNSTGFTITEMLIALAILIIVGGMTAVIFRSTQQSFTNAKAFQHVIDLARQTVLRMHTEIKATFIDFSGMANLVGIDAGGSHIKTDSVEDEIFFIAPNEGAAAGDICEVGYWQRTDGNLIRHFECPADFDFDTVDSDDELGLVLMNLDFKYFDGADYVDSWDTRPDGAQSRIFPRTIKFSFFVADEANIIKKEFGSQVRIASSAR